jgi:hypothetical protein
MFGEVFSLVFIKVHQLSESLLDSFVFLFIDEEKFDFHQNVLMQPSDLTPFLGPHVNHHPRFIALLHQSQQLLRLRLHILLHISSNSLQNSLLLLFPLSVSRLK